MIRFRTARRPNAIPAAWAALGLALALSVCTRAEAQLAAPLIGYDDLLADPTPAVIAAIDPATGADTVPAEYTGCPAGTNPPNTLFGSAFISGLALIEGTPYGLEWALGSGPDIYLLTITTFFCASGSRVGSAPVGYTNLESLAYSTGDEMLYSQDFSFAAHEGRLIRIDPMTGLGEAVGGAMTTDIRIVGMAYDPNADLLYGVTSAFGARTSPELVTISPVTGAIVDILGETGTAANSIESLAIDFSGDDPRWLAAGTTLYELNPMTGAAAPLGGAFNGIVWGLAAPVATPPPPENAVLDWSRFE